MSTRVWDREIAGFCPGIGKGRLYSATEIEEIMAGRKETSGIKTVKS
jgi:hypothetical protein